jgi:hypothetical protein
VAGLDEHMMLRLPWDHGGEAAACGQGSIAVIALTTFSEQVFVGHSYYHDFKEAYATDKYNRCAVFDWVRIKYDYHLFKYAST